MRTGVPHNHTDLIELGRDEIVAELKKLVFTGARDWRRTIRIDREARDLIVRAMEDHNGR